MGVVSVLRRVGTLVEPIAASILLLPPRACGLSLLCLPAVRSTAYEVLQTKYEHEDVRRYVESSRY